MNKGLLIGELSRRLHLSTQTIRYYERLGLLNPPKRTESQYRVYGTDDEERLRFIQKAKQFGLSLDEIKQLIEIRTSGTPPCSALKRMVKQHLDELARRICDMLAFRQELASRYEAIESLLTDAYDTTTETSYGGKICGLIEQSSETISTEGRSCNLKQPYCFYSNIRISG
ncbi:heavy metal-responsive transcriptional regulator [Chroococcidiopsis sp. TS-821]|uniref:heavy metal-responsive transcriptional regulator n=1 Tax=Chroococcidiopsis sp. TS-821 TaxID=1378066 RepID=UPI000D431B12|nr:heavy metal-responsive transcriptional regulator [Chroococcidiopsis sp. TS-821]PPS40911.1 heavy metal-responsive transcriptional regulator [Chroococcidiopsis sp. TS-821]